MIENLIEGDQRKPVAFLKYGPDIDPPDPQRFFGPTMFGELLWPVTIERIDGKTRIGVSYVRPDNA